MKIVDIIPKHVLIMELLYPKKKVPGCITPSIRDILEYLKYNPGKSEIDLYIYFRCPQTTMNKCLCKLIRLKVVKKSSVSKTSETRAYYNYSIDFVGLSLIMNIKESIESFKLLID